MHTFRKLPTAVPKIVRRMADASFIVAPAALRPSTREQPPVRWAAATTATRALRLPFPSPDRARTAPRTDRAARRTDQPALRVAHPPPRAGATSRLVGQSWL